MCIILTKFLSGLRSFAKHIIHFRCLRLWLLSSLKSNPVDDTDLKRKFRLYLSSMGSQVYNDQQSSKRVNAIRWRRGMCPAAITALLFDENLKRAFSRGERGLAEWRVARRMGGRKYYWRSWSPSYRFLTEVSYEVSSLVLLDLRASRRSF